MTIIIPTTAQDKNKTKYYFEVSGDDGKTYTACLSQIRVISSKRIFRKIGTIDKHNYDLLLEKVLDMLKGTL